MNIFLYQNIYAIILRNTRTIKRDFKLSDKLSRIILLNLINLHFYNGTNIK